MESLNLEETVLIKLNMRDYFKILDLIDKYEKNKLRNKENYREKMGIENVKISKEKKEDKIKLDIINFRTLLL